MNKIYKVKKNAAGHSVACSEFAKGHTRKAVLGSLLVIGALGMATVASTANAQAQVGTADDLVSDVALSILEELYNDNQANQAVITKTTHRSIENKIYINKNQSDITELKNDIYGINGIGKDLLDLNGRLLDQDAYAKQQTDAIDALNKASSANTDRIATAEEHIEKNEYDIKSLENNVEDLYEATNDNLDKISQLDTDVFKNTQNIQDLAKAQLAGVAAMDELNNNVEANKRDLSAVTGKAFKNQIDIQRNNDSIEDLYEANAENVERLVEHDRAIEILAEAGNHHDDLIRKNKADIAKNQADIKDLAANNELQTDAIDALNKASSANTDRIATAEEHIEKNEYDIKSLENNVEDLYEATNDNLDKISQLDGAVVNNSKNIQDNTQNIEDLLAYTQLNDENDQQQTDAIDALNKASSENTQNIEDLAAYNELQDAYAKQQTEAIDALNKASSANTDSIAKNQADIANNINNIYELAQQQDQHSSDIKTLAKVSAANKADADASFETLTKNQNTLIEQNETINQELEDLAAYNELQDAYAKQQTDAIDALNKASSANTDRIATAELGIAENKKDALIAKAQANENKDGIAKNQADIQLHDQKINNLGILHSMVAGAVGANKNRIDQNKADIDANKADADASFETLTKNQNTLIEQGEEHGRLIAQNQTNIQTLENNVEEGLLDLSGRLLDQKTAIEQNTGKTTVNGFEIEKNKTAIAKNQADIQTLENNVGEGLLDLSGRLLDQKAEISAVAGKTFKNQVDIIKNKAEADANFATLTQNQNTLIEQNETINQELEGLAAHANTQDQNIQQNQADITANKTAIEQNVNRTAVNGFEIEKNKTAIVKNKADIQDLAKAQLAGVEVMKELNSNVQKNQADIANNINNIYELAQQQDQHSSDIKTLAKVSAANTDRIAKNKADADESFKTLTENQNTLIEQGNKQAKQLNDAQIAINQNQADITANKTAIEQNVNKIAANGFEIEKNKTAIAANQQGLIIQNNRLNQIGETNNRQDQKIDQLGYALKEQGQHFNNRISAVERQTAGGIANAIAIATLPSPSRAGEHHVLFGSGYHNGQAAVSLGAAGLSDTGKSTYKIGLSWSDAGGLSGGVGGSYRWK